MEKRIGDTDHGADGGVEELSRVVGDGPKGTSCAGGKTHREDIEGHRLVWNQLID